MLQPRSMGMGCRALALVGLATTLSASAAFASTPFDLLGGLGSQSGSQGQSQGGKKPLTMVMPAQFLPTAKQLNRSVNFNDLGLSQTAVGNNIMQTAIVSVSQLGSGDAPKTMFLPYSQLGAIQALNLNLNINVVAVTQLAVGNNIQQVAIVNVEQKNQGGSDDPWYGGGGQQGGGQQGGGQQGGGQQGGGQQGGGKKDTTLVAPWDDVPMLKSLNKSLNYNLLQVSQTAIGDNIGQTAILSVGQSNGGSSGGLGTPMFLPANQLSAYKALNLHLNINVIALTQVAIGNNIQQVALVTVGQSN
jgi:hypothetical protein